MWLGLQDTQSCLRKTEEWESFLDFCFKKDHSFLLSHQSGANVGRDGTHSCSSQELILFCCCLEHMSVAVAPSSIHNPLDCNFHVHRRRVE